MKWLEIRTANFTLYSNASSILTQDIGLNLERFREALSAVSDMEVRSPFPVHVYVFENRKSYKRYVKEPDSTGVFFGDTAGLYLAVYPAPDHDVQRIAYHEYIHYCLRNDEDSLLPTFLQEGIAEYFETFSYGENQVEIGRPVEIYARVLAHAKTLPLKALLEQSSLTPGQYIHAWAVAHYLLSGERARQLKLFGRLLRDAVPMDEAFDRAFETTYTQLAEEVMAYLRKGSYPFMHYTFADLAIDERTSVAPMQPIDVLCRLGDFLMARGSSRDAARHYRAAMRIDARHADALAGLGWVAASRGRVDEAVQRLAAAIELDPDDYTTQLLFGMSLVLSHVRGGGSEFGREAAVPSLIAEAREHFRQSISLNPGVARAYTLFGATYLWEPGDLEPGIRALEKALTMMPRDSETIIDLLYLYLKSGQRERGEALAASVENRGMDRDVVVSVQEILLHDDLRSARAMLSDGRRESAIEILLRIRDQTSNSDLRARAEELLHRAQENEPVSVEASEAPR